MNHQDTVFACIDGLATTHAVVDGAFWAAERLQAPMALLHALERPEPMPPVGDYSGVIGMGAQDMLLERLNTLDEERTHVAQEAARRMLDEAQARVDQTRIPSLQVLLRHGELTDVLLEHEDGARLFVLGRQHRATAARKLRLDHRVESVIRNVRQPVMVMTTPEFTPPEGFVVAFDGSTTARRAVEAVARSPLLRGMPGLLAMAGEPTPEMLEQLHGAQAQLQQAGFAIDTRVVPGLPEEALPALLQSLGNMLLVLGAYGHSRIRQLIVGSTTTALLRLCSVPVVVLR
ncbi:MAG: universal stress protein [Alicycliphilus sp.]|jgi:nucleotide-binding universal stress UspA family protein|nr:universal stress protein [Alicycliphilus sp.]MBP7326914.1 universal stress protein [Alicycliphilus sp.]MBP7327949.1 universal stress protein [Alicycliphilus sp.]MBP8780468.1 universal stress protein [Alicycliphilus sp.]TXJ09696.1 MAG: universal stress protein [Alicycliphilus sp.]